MRNNTLVSITALCSLMACGENSTTPSESQQSFAAQSSSEALSSALDTPSSSSEALSTPESSSSQENPSSSSVAEIACRGPIQVRLLTDGASFNMGAEVLELLAHASSRRDSALIQSLAASGTPESPVHSVTFNRDIFMDVTEVTQHQFTCILEEAGDSTITQNLRHIWEEWVPALAMGDNQPAWGITPEFAVIYANALSLKEGLTPVYTIDSSGEQIAYSTDYSANGYRLPTEAEWEFAARGGTTQDFYWGLPWSTTPTAADSALHSSHMTWAANSFDWEDTPQYGPHTAGSKEPNAYGLYDMLGNLSEWCNDYYHFEPYPSTAQTDPHRDDDGDNGHVIRGGNWTNSLLYQRVTNRTYLGGTYPPFTQGMRLVRLAP